MRKNDDTMECNFANYAARCWPVPRSQTIVRVCFCDTSIQMGALSCWLAANGMFVCLYVCMFILNINNVWFKPILHLLLFNLWLCLFLLRGCLNDLDLWPGIIIMLKDNKQLQIKSI